MTIWISQAYKVKLVSDHVVINDGHVILMKLNIVK